MTRRELKGVFTVPVAVMFLAYLWAVVSCPPPRPDELPLMFGMGVAFTLIPAFSFFFIARKLSEE